jgi:phage gpG-like protein
MAVSSVQVHDERLKRVLANLNGDWPRLQEMLLRRYAEEVGKNARSNVTGGNPLHVRTGRLRGSIGYEFRGDDTVAVGTNVHYGKYHEFGNGVPQRPWLGPALNTFAGSARQDSIGRSVLRRFMRAAQ